MDDVYHERTEGDGVTFAQEAAPCGTAVWGAVLVDRHDEGEAIGPGMDETGRAGGGE